VEVDAMRSKSFNPVRFIALVSAVAGLGAGCGSVHAIPIEQTSTDIAQTVCSAAYRCCSLSQLKGNKNAGTDISMDASDCTVDTAACESACESESASFFSGQLSLVQTSVTQKRAVYEQSKVDACLQTIRSATCDVLNMTNRLTGVPGCDSFVTPLVPLGGTCTQSYECIGGWCQLPTGGGDGVCTATVAAGQSCTAGTDSCAPGLKCDNEGTPNDHSDDVCVQPGAVGAVCTDGTMCASGICSSSGGSGMTCAAATAPMCFYGGGCAAGGDGRPGPGTIALLGLFVVVALARARRMRDRP
jgi:MYXO-CTERM domain-containing protein